MILETEVYIYIYIYLSVRTAFLAINAPLFQDPIVHVHYQKYGPMVPVEYLICYEAVTILRHGN